MNVLIPDITVMQRMQVAIKILYRVAVYRLQNLEMANVFAAVSIMLAIQLPWDDVAVRFSFCLLLNLLVYLNNDYCNVDQDIVSPNKDRYNAQFLKEHMGAALGIQIVLFLVLLLIGLLWSYGLIVALIAGVGTCWLYSWKLKGMPYLDILAAFVGGVALPLAGFPLDSLLGWILVGQLALFSVCFHLIQMMRDYGEDMAVGMRTTAVQLGVPRTKIILCIVMILVAAYAVLVLNRWIGVILLGVLFISMDPSHVDRYWNRARLIMGLTWLLLLGWIYWFGSSYGALLSVGNRVTLGALTWIR